MEFDKKELKLITEALEEYGQEHYLSLDDEEENTINKLIGKALRGLKNEDN